MPPIAYIPTTVSAFVMLSVMSNCDCFASTDDISDPGHHWPLTTIDHQQVQKVDSVETGPLTSDIGEPRTIAYFSVILD